MPNFNKVFLMGNLTKDPELRYTAGGAPVANLRMAINRAYQSQSGEKKEDVCFVTVVVWRKQAEAAGEYLKKGDPLFVEGRLQSRTWETDDKQKRTIMEVVAERIQFLNRGKGGGRAAAKRSMTTWKKKAHRSPRQPAAKKTFLFNRMVKNIFNILSTAMGWNKPLNIWFVFSWIVRKYEKVLN